MFVTAVTSHVETWPCVAWAVAGSLHHSARAPWRLPLSPNADAGGGGGGGEGDGGGGPGDGGGGAGGGGGDEGSGEGICGKQAPQVKGHTSRMKLWLHHALKSTQLCVGYLS